MADDINVGSVSVDVVPNAKGFSKRLAAQINPQAKSLGEQIGKRLSEQIAQSIKSGIGEGFVGSGPISSRQGKATGKNFGGSFAEEARSRIKAALTALPTVQIGVATTAADQHIKDLKLRLAALGGKTIGVDITDTDALAEMAFIEAELTRIGAESPNIQVRVDSAAAVAELAAIQAQVAALDGSNVDVNDKGLSRASSAMSGLVVGALALGPALIPVAAAVGGLVAALGAPLAAAGGGLTLFALIGGKAIKDTSKVAKQIDMLKKKADTLLNPRAAQAARDQAKALEDSLTGPQKAFLAARTQLSKAFATLTTGKTGAALFAPIVQGTQLLAKILPALSPVIISVSKAISSLLAAASSSVSGGGIKAFAASFAGAAYTSIVQFGKTFGNFAVGLFNFFGAFGPLSKTFMSGLQNMSKSFLTFSKTADANSGLQSFIAYVQKVGPQVIATVGAMIQAFVRIGVALAPIGAVALGVIRGFAGMINAIPIPILGAIASAIITVAVAVKVWSVAMAILNAVMSANPISLVVLAIAALAAGLTYAYKNSETFRNIVNGAFAAIQTVVGSVIDFVRSHLSLVITALAIVGGPVTILAALFIKNFSRIRSAVSAVVGAIQSAASAVSGAFSAMVSAVSTAAGRIASTVKAIPGKIVDAFKGAGSLLLGAGAAIMDGLIAGITSKLRALGSKLASVTNFIKDHKGPIEKDRVLLTPAGRAIMDGLVKGLQSGSAGLSKYLARVTKAITDSLANRKAQIASEKHGKGVAASLRRSAEAQARSMKAAVAAQGRALAAITKKTQVAQQKLADLVSQRESLASSISSSISGELDLGSLVKVNGLGVGKTPTFAAVAGAVSGLASKVKAFAGKLKALLAAGIPAGLVQEVASLGTTSGIAVADALLSGSKQQIGQLAADYAGLDTYSKQVGNVVAGGMFDAGIQAQQGILKGLLDDKAIQHAADELSHKLTKAVKRSLGIKSPSRVFQNEVGRYIPAGIVSGINDGQRALDHRVANMVPLAKIGAFTPGAFAAGVAASGNATPTFNIYPQPGQSEAEIGRAAAKRLMWAMTS